MIAFVLDASMTLAWCFDDEATPLSEKVLDRLDGGGEEALCPSLWPYEVGNGIRMAERRNRISAEQGDGLLHYLYDLPVEVAELSSTEILGPVARLAREENLTIYDASYLYMAIEEDLPLASLDGPLTKAATRRGVTVLE
jgi:predicted nucleic acid-binding protein